MSKRTVVPFGPQHPVHVSYTHLDVYKRQFTKRADAYYHEVSYADGDYLMFGRESVGIDADVLAAHPERCLRIPMLEREGLSPATTQGPLSDPADPDAVSLNLSNAANIVLFEALRQLGFPGVI